MSLEIAVWYAPIEDLEKWKKRGVTTLFGCPVDRKLDGWINRVAAWETKARSLNLNYVLQREAMPLSDDVHLVGIINTPDEPDGVGGVSPGNMQDQYKDLKHKYPNTPVFINFDGRRTPFTPPAVYAAYGKACDIAAFDDHVINFGDGPENIPRMDYVVRQIASASGHPVWACVETSDQDLRKSSFGLSSPGLAAKMRGPTADEFREEVDTVVHAGANGIIYFPQVIGAGWEAHDGTTPEVEQAMMKVAVAYNPVSIPVPKKTLTRTITVSVYSDGTTDINHD